jgi:penicillin-binding protein 1A
LNQQKEPTLSEQKKIDSQTGKPAPAGRWGWIGMPKRPWVLAVAGVAGFAAFGAGSALGAWSQACAAGCPTVEQIADLQPQQASLVLDGEGAIVGQFFRERRQLVRLRELPRHVPLAFVAIEDRRFFEHEGIDPVRLVGAVRDNVLEGFGASGGSTITMQLARNLFPQQLPMGEKTLRRKVAEARLAVQMERGFSKEQILELYLNHIYLGAGAYGIEAAARSYFDKPASELTVAEASLLAGLPKAPSSLNPRRNPDGAELRRMLVVDAMAQTGVITPEQAAEVRSQPVQLAPPSGARSAPYFVEHIRRELEPVFGELLYTGGLRIITSLDSELQREAELALEEQIREIERGRHGRFRHPTYEQFSASLAESGTREVSSTPYLQGVVAVLDPMTGDVLALVGGRDFRHSQFNRATQALRQPGSAFKPFVFGAALEHGRSPQYRVADTPFSLALSDGSTWTPRNYSGDFHGMMTLRHALRISKNIPAIRLGEEVGIDPVRDFARRAGIGTEIPRYPSIHIGSAAVRPLNLIASYASFANGGMRIEPQFIRRIEDNQGRLIWAPAPQTQPAMDPAAAFLLTDMLREAVDRGTGYAVRNPAIGNIPFNVPAAGKTGTTNDATDVWFVGYTPDLVAGVWLGLDQPRRIMHGATGGGLAVPVWARVVRSWYEKNPVPEAWQRPPGIATRRISYWTGKAVSEDCPFAFNSYIDEFVATAAPTPGCEYPTYLSDPTPHLPGRPVYPGQPRVPRPEDFVAPSSQQRRP